MQHSAGSTVGWSTTSGMEPQRVVQHAQGVHREAQLQGTACTCTQTARPRCPSPGPPRTFRALLAHKLVVHHVLCPPHPLHGSAGRGSVRGDGACCDCLKAAACMERLLHPAPHAAGPLTFRFFFRWGTSRSTKCSAQGRAGRALGCVCRVAAAGPAAPRRACHPPATLGCEVEGCSRSEGAAAWVVFVCRAAEVGRVAMLPVGGNAREVEKRIRKGAGGGAGAEKIAWQSTQQRGGCHGRPISSFRGHLG